MTVRRDLELLRKNHVLERSYGYATLVEGGNGYSYEGETYDLRRARLENFSEKDRIAKYAASLIRPGDWVFLDNGTTVSRMTFYLPTEFEFTVLCYNFIILAELLKHANVHAIFPGGVLPSGGLQLYFPRGGGVHPPPPGQQGLSLGVGGPPEFGHHLHQRQHRGEQKGYD